MKFIVTIHLLCDSKLSDDNLLKLKKFMNYYSSNTEMVFYNMKDLFMIRYTKRFTQACMYKFLTPVLYDVDRIIRVGSCGSYDKDYKVYDTILVSSAYSDSNYAKIGFGINNKVAKPSSNLNSLIKRKAKKLKINLKTGKIYSSDIFYSAFGDRWKDIHTKKKCIGVEMESFALFTNANVLGKEAACLLTVSDSFVSNEAISSRDRETNFNEMIKLALELA